MIQEPITWSLHLPYKPLESTLSDEKLFIEINLFPFPAVFDAIWTVGKAVRNYGVCMGIRWQISFCKIKFYTISEPQYQNTRLRNLPWLGGRGSRKKSHIQMYGKLG